MLVLNVARAQLDDHIDVPLSEHKNDDAVAVLYKTGIQIVPVVD